MGRSTVILQDLAGINELSSHSDRDQNQSKSAFRLNYFSTMLAHSQGQSNSFNISSPAFLSGNKRMFWGLF